jgi:hypothetical protein
MTHSFAHQTIVTAQAWTWWWRSSVGDPDGCWRL